MQIIEFNHKTVANLMKKSVEEYWLNDKDAWMKFTDGSVVRIHVLAPEWKTYVELGKPKNTCVSRSFHDSLDVWQFLGDKGEEPFTSRTVSIDFDNARYYYHENHYDYTKREYLPVIEFHYYEKGEEIGRNDS